MTEITRVPIQPIAKGSLIKVWLGVIIAIALGAGLAWAAMPKGFSVTTLVEGEGDPPEIGQVVFAHYEGRLASTGEVFDNSRDNPFPTEGVLPDGVPFRLQEGEAIEGFFQGLQQTKKGGTYEIYIPAEMAYGAEPPPTSPIPPNADLIFEIEVTDILSLEEVQRRVAIWQQMMQSQMGGPGGPGGPPGGPGGPPPQ